MAPRITLYGLARVPFTEKCRRALVLKGLAFELREPSGPEDFRRWSPKTGLLPVMTIDDAAQLHAIAQASKTDDYRLRTVIENFVTSDLFQKR